MIDNTITHHIQKYILSVLLRKKIARFSELRKPGTDSNLFAYHLKLLARRKIVIKLDGGYTLGQKGLQYSDRFSEEKGVRLQPKVVCALVLQNSNGDVLLWKRDKQPYIDRWTLPHGKVHIEDLSIETAAVREAKEKIGLTELTLVHAGDCYVRVYSDDDTISVTMMHIFKGTTDAIAETDTIVWARPHKLSRYEMAPAAEKIITRTFFNDPHFFEEFNEEL